MPRSVKPRQARPSVLAAVVTLALAAGVTASPAVAADGPAAGRDANVSAAAVDTIPADRPTGLRVDGLDRPADLEDLTSPDFSWQLVSTPRQSAYRVVVATTRAGAAAGEGDVWDSGKVGSAQQGGVAYAGPTLEASRRYFWSVQVWDGRDRALERSEPSWFGTGPGASWEGATPIWAPSPATGWDDYTVTARLTVTAVAVGLRFRVSGNNSYMWQFRGGDNRLVPHKQTNGTYATLGSSVNLPAGTLAVGRTSTVSIQVQGSTITTSIDGVQVDQRTDTSYASGIVGVRTGNSEAGTLDDLSVVASGGRTLVSDGFGGANPFACGTVTGGALSIPNASNCALAGFGNDWAMLRTDVQVEDKPIAWASLFATGTEWRASKQYVYKAAIDGRFVGLGPTAPIGTETRYDGFDVTSMLTPGRTSTLSVVANSSSNDARVLAQLVIAFTDGTRQVVGTGADWQALSAGQVYRSPGSYGTSYFSAPREYLDAQRFPTGYDRPGFDASGWVPAQERAAIAGLRSAPMAKVGEQSRAAASVTTLADGSQVVDFGRTWLGGISWDVAAGVAGTQVQVRFGQVLNADGSVRHQTTAGNTYLDAVTLADGAQQVETWGLRTFRYVQVIGSPEPVTDDSLHALALVYPFDEQASALASPDEALNQVYALSKNTIEATNLNFYTDSWERERTNYEADAYLQLMSSLYLMDDLSLGRYSMDYFATNRTWPTEWPAYVVLAVHDAWRQTGDTEQVAASYDTLVSKLPSKWIDPTTGLVRKTTGSNGCNSVTDCDIVDWPTSERDGYRFAQHNTVVNALTYRALRDMAEMAGALGKDADAETYAAQAAALRTAINTRLFDAANGAYDDGADASGVLTGHRSVHASAFALAFGVPTDAERGPAAAYVKSRGMACSVYCAAFLIQGLYGGGDGQTALDLLTGTGTRSWLNMIRVGAGATMEAWDVSLKANTTYSHPWAASPAFNVPGGLFGIQPASPGYGEVSIRPQPGSLPWGTISTPTVRGSVGVGFERDDAGTTLVASVPGNTRARVGVPTTASATTTLYVDGVARQVEPEGGFLTVALPAGCHVLTPEPDPAVDLDRLLSVCEVAPSAGFDVAATVSDDGGQGWFGADAVLSLTRTGGAPDASEVPELEHRVDAGEWTRHEGPVALAAGEHVLGWRLVDADGVVVASGERTVRVDAIAPEVVAGVEGRTVRLDASDADSGVATVEQRLDGGAWTSYAGPLVLDAAAHAVTFRATDRAGNTSAVGTVDVPAAPGPVAVAPVVTAAPQVTGTPRAGERLTATAGAWDVPVVTGLQWLRDGVPVDGATAPSYLLGRADVGARMSVRVTAAASTAPAGAPTGVATSAATAPVARLATTASLRVRQRPVRVGARLRVTVRVASAEGPVAGTVEVSHAGVVRTLRLREGRARFTVRASGRASRTVVVRYLGDPTRAPSSATVRYRVR